MPCFTTLFRVLLAVCGKPRRRPLRDENVKCNLTDDDFRIFSFDGTTDNCEHLLSRAETRFMVYRLPVSINSCR